MRAKRNPFLRALYARLCDRKYWGEIIMLEFGIYKLAEELCNMLILAEEL